MLLRLRYSTDASWRFSKVLGCFFVQQNNLQKNPPSKRFNSVFIDPGNRTFSTMYSPEGFSGSIGDRDISRIFKVLKVHDKA